MEQILKVGDEIEFNGKRYRAEAEVEKCTCIGCDLYDDGERLCGDRFPCGGHLIFKEVKEVKETPRHIELGVVKVEGDNVTFRIVEQTHRCGEFIQQGSPSTFKASNGIGLRSRAFPEWKDDGHLLYCRGRGCGEDDKELNCTAVDFAKISEAVSEYNITDGKGYEKPWPQNGDEYFYIDSNGVVKYATFEAGVEFDARHKAYGNFFRTKEDAMAAAEKVKTLFKELAAK